VILRILRQPARKQRSRRWNIAESALIVAGLAAVGFAGYSYIELSVYQAYAMRRFERGLPENPAMPSSPVGSATAVWAKDGAGDVIGKITIPRLGISAIVKEGVDRKTLKLAVGHIPLTAMPGQTGNIGLAAHRDTFFRNLKGVQQNDVIALATNNATFLYRVFSLRTVYPPETYVLAASGSESTLTLITCYPFYFVGHAPKRFVVRARQVANIRRTEAF
jgi:sortase A